MLFRSVQAAQDQIALDAGRGETLSQFLNKYSPANQNNTNAYIDFVSQQTGLNPDDPISLASGYSASTADTPVDTTVDTSGSMQTAAMPIDFTDPVTLAIAGLAGLLFVWLVFRG